MAIPAPRRRPSTQGMWGRGYGGQTAMLPDMGRQLRDVFQQTLTGMMSPEEMYEAESAPVESAFTEAGEKMRSRLAASGGAGNIRAIQAGEERLARTKGETLGKLRSDVTGRAMSQQLLGAQLLKLLREMGAGGGFSGAGTALYGR